MPVGPDAIVGVVGEKSRGRTYLFSTPRDLTIFGEGPCLQLGRPPIDQRKCQRS